MNRLVKSINRWFMKCALSQFLNRPISYISPPKKNVKSVE